MIMVANPRSGTGKTPVTLMLAATFGHYRNGSTLAWEISGAGGALGRQAGSVPAFRGGKRDLPYPVGAVPATGIAEAARPPGADFDVLASDDVAGGGELTSETSFERLHATLSRRYEMMILDSGNDIQAPGWVAAVRSADCLVVPITIRAYGSESGLWALHQANAFGQQRLARSAIAVLSCTDPRVDQETIARIAERYRTVMREVLVVPFDERLRRAETISYRKISEPARRAYANVAATVMHILTAG
jgi:MinD-like ATPase involved in chromosome partitioning or flagellar assembly